MADAARGMIAVTLRVPPAIEERLGEMRADEAGSTRDDDAHAARRQAVMPRWKRPRSRVSHMILMSSVTDQFSM